MSALTEWRETDDAKFAGAVEAIAETMAEDHWSFEFALEHYADLYGIEREALRHEWNLRREDDR